MGKVNYIIITELTRTLYKWKPPGWEKINSIDNNFLYKVWKERYLRYFVDKLYIITS